MSNRVRILSWEGAAIRKATRIIFVALVSGLVMGLAGFTLGFFGPLILAPHSNQGPLLGIFVTGPLGFLIGLVFGGVSESIKQGSAAITRNRLIKSFPNVWAWILCLGVGLAIVTVVVGRYQIPRHEAQRSPILSASSDVTTRDESMTQIRCREFSDGDILTLSKLQQLTSLDFTAGYARYEAKLTDKGLRNIAELRLPHLELLSIGYCFSVTDAGLRHIADINTLREISLMGCTNLSDAALLNIASSTTLMGIDLRGCDRITDQGLQSLAKMPSLLNVSVGGCSNITSVGIAEFQKIRPDCHIEKNDKEWSFHAPPP